MTNTEDKIGKIFDNCMETFFLYIMSSIKGDPVHISDVSRFGKSVVQFRIDECPGWLFGLYLIVPNLPDIPCPDLRYINGKFTAQYENVPCRSTASNSANNVPASGSDCDFYDNVTKMIAFIRDEPYLAFCREYLGWDYNKEYHTREEAKKVYDEYHSFDDDRSKVIQENDEKLFKFMKEKVFPRFNRLEVIDYGEHSSPRYLLIAPYDLNTQFASSGKPGGHLWFRTGSFFNPVTEEDQKLHDEFNMIESACKKNAEKYGIKWYPQFSTIIHYYVEKEKSWDKYEVLSW